MNNFVVVINSVNDAYTNVKERNYDYINEELTFLTLIVKKNQKESVKIAQMIITEKGDEYFDEYYDENSDESDLEDEEENQKNIIETKLKLLNNTWVGTSDLKRKNTFAILNTRHDNQAASRLYQNNFPDLQIFGLLGYEQSGHDYFPIKYMESGEEVQPKVDRTPTEQNNVIYEATSFETGQYDCSVLTVFELN